jgi:hypothetical protein
MRDLMFGITIVICLKLLFTICLELRVVITEREIANRE